MPNWLRRRGKPTAYTVGALTISDPWARGPSEVAPQCGGFFVVSNTAQTWDRLVAASSKVAASVEIHAIRVVGADIKMRRLEDGLQIPAEATVTLKPRGYHLLMNHLAVPLAKGALLPVTLVFEKAGPIDIELVVRDPGLVGNEILVEERSHG